jgi:transcriptional regulator with XRE-family HTH domain
MSKLPQMQILREKNGFTREDVAKILRISIHTYTSYELGNREPNIVRIRQLSKLFKCTIDELLEE